MEATFTFCMPFLQIFVLIFSLDIIEIDLSAKSQMAILKEYIKSLNFMQPVA
jgi:hypothetical protein